METLLIKVELSDFEFNGATLITPETFWDKKKKKQENQMPPVNYFDYFSPLADSTESIDRLDKIAWLFVVILLLTDIILFSLLMFQSAIHKPKQFFTAPLTKYVCNYVSKI